MIQETKKRPRKKGRKRKSSGIFNLKRLFFFATLIFVLIASICAVGYVIFFRTVFAQEILPTLRSAIVFEEPDPPSVHLETLVPEKDTEPAGGGALATEESSALIEPSAPSMEPISPEQGVSVRQPDLPKVAIIIDDMGYDEVTGRELLNLPLEMTYSFLPFAPHSRKLQHLANSAGKTIFLHLPLQPKGTAYNAGPGALYLEDSPEVQKTKLLQCLQEVPSAIGVNNHMGSLFTEDERAMTNLILEIKGRSLIFVDSFTSPASVAFQVAQAASVVSARRNVFLDNVQDEQKICGQLDKLVQIAEKKGKAIGIGHPHRATVNAIAKCGEKYRTRVRYVGIPGVLN